MAALLSNHLLSNFLSEKNRLSSKTSEERHLNEAIIRNLDITKNGSHAILQRFSHQRVSIVHNTFNRNRQQMHEPVARDKG
jgi:hypothetical protein